MAKTVILCDGHVHIHPCYDLEKFFKAAIINFKSETDKVAHGMEPAGVLWLTESKNAHCFKQLSGKLARIQIPGWTFRPTLENNSLLGTTSAGDHIFVVAGRQIVTAEKLEVLALGTDQDIEDGRPIREVLSLVTENGALAVIPWGAGKWWGKRGVLLHSLLLENAKNSFFLGDNGGRPRLWSYPPLLHECTRLGIRILSGSDPLPFADEALRPGSFGFRLQGGLDAERPATSIINRLRDPAEQIAPFGRHMGLARFVRNQVGLRLQKLSISQLIART